MVVGRTACGMAGLNTSGRGRVVTDALTTGEAVNAVSPIFRAGTAKAEMKERKKTTLHLQKYTADVG